MNWKKLGFTQRKPKEPGVYFVSNDHVPLNPPARLIQGWDIADVMFFAGSFSNAHENREDAAHWRIHTLGGISYGWKKGLWMKGPIKP